MAGCTLCGTERDQLDPDALAWASERDVDGEVRWLCPACARRHVRDIEAKLPAEYW